MAKQQYRCNFRLKKSNAYLGTIYLGSPLPEVEDMVVIGDKKYTIVELNAGSTHDSTEVYVKEAE